jgi:excinuclease UvrABC ATPase subunit
MSHIQVVGASIHNLKKINVTLPKGKFIVFTGVSGSGKSSLAVDILYEEGRKRYLQSIGFNSRGEVIEEQNNAMDAAIFLSLIWRRSSRIRTARLVKSFPTLALNWINI